jgi:hypothetical protein
VAASERKAIADGLRALARGDANLDVKPLAGHPGWYRLRIGSWRALYFSDVDGIVIDRIVNRRDLERAVDTLS